MIDTRNNFSINEVSFWAAKAVCNGIRVGHHVILYDGKERLETVLKLDKTIKVRLRGDQLFRLFNGFVTDELQGNIYELPHLKNWFGDFDVVQQVAALLRPCPRTAVKRIYRPERRKALRSGMIIRSDL